jgi:CRP-like cAMP-binding protein
MAVEDCILLEISFDEEQKLKASNHKFETFFRVIAERSTAFMQRRILSNLTSSAEDRYAFFLKKYPQLANRFPQYVVASYLGMTTEFLSKIRNLKVKRKA